MHKRRIFVSLASIIIFLSILIGASISDNKDNKMTDNNIIFNISETKLKKYLFDIQDFVDLKNNINNYYGKDISQEELDKIQKEFDNLIQDYQQLLINDVNNLTEQFIVVTSFKQNIKNLFEDDEMTIVIQSINRSQLEDIQNQLNSLSRQDLKEQYQPYLDNILIVVEEKEEAERKRREAEAAELARINNAYIEIGGIPYISQTAQQVYNGCEAASVLMGLKYRGYLTNVSLREVASSIPITDNPHTGFVRSIFDKEPANVPHWIAPDALTNFFITYSGYPNISNITGASTDQLKQEINSGNPVVVYVTYKFGKPANWIEEMPNNLHVVLLTGYNSITGAYIVQDPYGSGRMIINKNTFESIYNQLGRNAVVIR